jgi:hypothetical protein
MNSTSDEVGELWNGQTTVRTLGSPDVKQLIFMKDLKSQYSESTESCFGLYSMEAAEAEDRIRREGTEKYYCA